MIDQTLISSATAHAKSAIKNSKSVIDNFKLVTDILSPDILIKLKEFIDTVDEKEWNVVPRQEFFPRKVINWVSDTVIEELYTVMDNLTSDINEQFNTTDKKFFGLALWRDTDGYEMPEHKDNSVIDISMQLYLFDCPERYGTTFRVNEKSIDVPFKHNTGYLLNQQEYDDRLVHWSTNKLTSGLPRYSLYLIWSVERN
jgi:hypothetical protein